MERLSNRSLPALPRHVARPAYGRDGLPVRIVHLGAGTFHRSHQAVYTDEAMQAGDARWGILAASLRNPAIGQALTPQDGLYTLLLRNHGQTSARVIGSLAGIACLADQRHEVLAALAAPQTEIVTLTITRRGYCYDPALGGLDTALPELELDLNAPQGARSALGVLALAILQRKKAGLAPFTLLSCDNLPANGKMLQHALEQYLDRVQHDLGDPGLLRYFMEQYACPCTLVDRITPPARAADLAEAENLLGLHDAAPVAAEPFSQWVIQDWFSAGRPRWEHAGALFTAHVIHYEQMRQRLLDASYCALGYLGAIAGYATVHSAMRDPEIRQFVSGLMDDAGATLARRTGVDWRDYKNQLLERLGNTSLELQISQLTMDGSQILPASIIEPARERLAHGLGMERHAMVLAAWIRFLTGLNERQEELFVNDPLRQRLDQALRDAGGRGASACDLTDAVLSIEEIFGAAPLRDLEFVRCVAAALESLLAMRVRPSLAGINAGRPV